MDEFIHYTGDDRTIVDLWNEAFAVGLATRRAGKCGLSAWQPLKRKYSNLYSTCDLVNKPNIQHVMVRRYVVDRDDTDHTNAKLAVGGRFLYNTVEIHHFVIQHVRIPTMMDFKLSVVKLCQIAYNAGQFAAVREAGGYDDTITAFYDEERLGDIATYTTDAIVRV